MVRLKERWADEYTSWQERPLGEHRYAYIWADGVYLGAGLERENSALLCILGAREDGTKELLAMQLGYRESTASWSEVLRISAIAGWPRRCWRLATVGWGSGRPCARCFRPRRTSAAGTIGC